ncbi:hypothetical protein DIRTYBETTY_151 [Bacillus phage DirtyBetty]|uniref:Uncharacterized protein n=2 Tax=Wphvirus megatron TaxID=1987728 RepID=A0A1B1PB17_9CAUD|nr:hypothetical protein QLX47_gp149 [Bacillus phage Eyuki]YP_009285093.1 hypothetical protein BIZ88_gp151 [Bacillus phage DirtyBetty]ALA46806.1 hypothetical protein EYUKI_149 [Bacillus phage Eyuki]ANT41345.1 hypothetical protein DIRTYBETTY_151 [Bacillus phage DirtyBetty]
MLNAIAKMSGKISNLVSNSNDFTVSIGEYVIVSSSKEGQNALVALTMSAKVEMIKVNDCTVGNLEKMIKVAKDTLVNHLVKEKESLYR